MKFVILHYKQIPDFTVCGPILTPTSYDIHQVLRWLAMRIDVREVMEDGSYRKLDCNDERLMEELNKKIQERKERKKLVNNSKVDDVQPRGNIRLKPEVKPPVEKPKKVVSNPKMEVKEEPKVEVKIEEPKQEVIGNFIDELEKPE